MMRIVAAALGAMFAASAAAAAPPDQVDPAVRAPLEAYLQGQKTGLPEHFRQAFHPDAELFGVRDGVLLRMTAQEFVNRASGKAASDEAQRKRWIEDIDVAGDTAVAKLVLDYPAVRFTDYMSLVKTEGHWLIVNKTFMVQTKSPPAHP